MTINQLSIFIENRQGTLLQVLDLFKRAGIQIIATNLADTVEYGILRIICTEPQKAFETLKKEGLAVNMTEVFAVEIDNEAGRGADAIASFVNQGVSIAYLYSFIVDCKGILIFRTDNPALAAEAISKNQLSTLSEKDLPSLV